MKTVLFAVWQGSVMGNRSLCDVRKAKVSETSEYAIAVKIGGARYARNDEQMY